uniref:required for excision 1-B domain-containing protein n=1 Tax=Myxine glutinosa TaxID=7769 RepID=UPI00358E3FAD
MSSSNHSNWSHKVYLHSGPEYGFQTFRQAVHEATEAFQKVSHDVLALREEARNAWPLLAVHIEQLQAAESEKLHLTVELQLAKQHLQHFPDEENEDEVRWLKQRINTTIEKIGNIMEDFKYDSEDIR